MKAIVKDVMSTNPVSVSENAPFKEIAAKLRGLRVSAFPVLDPGGKVVGVVSEADLLAREALEDRHGGVRGTIAGLVHHAGRSTAGGVTAADLMTSPAVTAAPDDTVEQAARLMYKRKVKRLPVVDAAGQLVGIVSRGDVLAVFDRSDDEIRAEIISEVIPDCPELSWYSVIVRNGVVTLEGTPPTASVGHGIVSQARHVQGVVAVRDRLSYPVPPVPGRPGPSF